MKYIKYAVWCVIIVTTFSEQLMAQRGYSDGYIVTLENDTIYGMVNTKSIYANTKNCEFKTKSDKEPVTYSPDDIRSYCIINKKLFVSKTVEIEDKAESVFLEFLIKGIVNLYQMEQKYFFIEKEGQLYQLSNDEIIRYNEFGTKYEMNSNKYIGTLTYLFEDSPEISREIGHTGFTAKPLMSLTEDYHNSVCDEYKCINYKKNKKLNFFLEPFFGVSIAYMSMSNASEHASDVGMQYGVKMRMGYATNLRSWHYIVGVNYSSNSFSGEYNLERNGKESIYAIDLDVGIIRIPLMVQYLFPLKKIQPAIRLGYNNVILIDPEYSIDRIIYYDSGLVRTLKNTSDVKKYHYGFVAGFDVYYHINDKSALFFNGSVEYRLPYANFNHILDNHRVTSVMLNVGYSFKLNK